MSEPVQVTELLHKLRLGDTEAQARVLPLVYQQLRRIAAVQMRRERPGTLQPTALVHEAYIKLVRMHDTQWQSRAHFLAVAAQVMQRMLVDNARTRHAQKNGGALNRVELPEIASTSGHMVPEILDLNRALEKLKEFDKRQAQVVVFRFFGGMTDNEIAEVLRVCRKTVQRDWKFARTWLLTELRKAPQAAAAFANGTSDLGDTSGRPAGVAANKPAV